MKAAGEKFVQQSSDFFFSLLFWSFKGLVCVSTSFLPPCQTAPLSPSLCALALEVTSFGVRQAGTQQEQLSLSELLNFSGGEEREGKIKNSPVMWSAESPPENSWHNNLNDQMTQRRLVSRETAS